MISPHPPHVFVCLTVSLSMALLLETTYILTTKDLQIVKRYKLFFNVKQTNLPDGLEYDSLLSTATGIAVRLTSNRPFVISCIS